MSKSILVIDDEKEQVELFDAFLKKCGYTVIDAYDGEEALDKVRKLKPDLILLDIKMPKMDGDELYMTLKEQDETKDIPIITVTGLRTEEELVKYPEENTFAKPVHFEELLAKIKELIGE